jgi:hypothetical protein
LFVCSEEDEDKGQEGTVEEGEQPLEVPILTWKIEDAME